MPLGERVELTSFLDYLPAERCTGRPNMRSNTTLPAQRASAVTRFWRLLALVALASCCAPGCRCSGEGDEPGALSAKLDQLTLENMSKAARAEGYKVREEVSEREELPGATIVRLTLDHAKQGTAFVDLYDFSKAKEHEAQPAVMVGPTKTLFVRVFTTRPSSEALMRSMVAATPLESQTRATMETTLKDGGWTLGDSSKLEDDITGHEIVDVVAHKGDADVLVVLLDYAQVASGKQQSAVSVDGPRVLLVDTEQRRWSVSLLRRIAK